MNTAKQRGRDAKAKEVRTREARTRDTKTREAKPRDPLCQCVKRSLKRYFKDMNGEEPNDLYHMVIGEIEKPLLEVVMEQSESNQTRAAKYLGINRNTLRKKLKQYNIE